jgi:hypothetical protein
VRQIDFQLTHDMLHALVAGDVVYSTAFTSYAEVSGEMSVEVFQQRASQVSGWDLIVVVGSYNSGEQLVDDPRLIRLDAPVLHAIETTEGGWTEGFAEVIVLRDGRIVGELSLFMEGSYPGGFVVEPLP